MGRDGGQVSLRVARVSIPLSTSFFFTEEGTHYSKQSSPTQTLNEVISMIQRTITPTPTQPITRCHPGHLSSVSPALPSASADSDAAIFASEFGLRSEALASYDGDEE